MNFPRFAVGIIVVLLGLAFARWQLSKSWRQAQLLRDGRETIATVVQVHAVRSASAKPSRQRNQLLATLTFDGIDFQHGEKLPEQFSRYSDYPTLPITGETKVGDRIPIVYDPGQPKTLLRGRNSDRFFTMLSTNRLTADFVLRISVSLVAFLISCIPLYAVTFVYRHLKHPS